METRYVVPVAVSDMI